MRFQSENRRRDGYVSENAGDGLRVGVVERKEGEKKSTTGEAIIGNSGVTNPISESTVRSGSHEGHNSFQLVPLFTATNNSCQEKSEKGKAL